ncbi:hypothetical protein BJ742DRAFT_868396 [Cladochytrium replicatum]|nr:hypothetical protein BJ742DRAFT_868396 [Cladochytrium replicatum]
MHCIFLCSDGFVVLCLLQYSFMIQEISDLEVASDLPASRLLKILRDYADHPRTVALSGLHSFGITMSSSPVQIQSVLLVSFGIYECVQCVLSLSSHWEKRTSFVYIFSLLGAVVHVAALILFVVLVDFLVNRRTDINPLPFIGVIFLLGSLVQAIVIFLGLLHFRSAYCDAPARTKNGLPFASALTLPVNSLPRQQPRWKWAVTLTSAVLGSGIVLMLINGFSMLAVFVSGNIAATGPILMMTGVITSWVSFLTIALSFSFVLALAKAFGHSSIPALMSVEIWRLVFVLFMYCTSGIYQIVSAVWSIVDPVAAKDAMGTLAFLNFLPAWSCIFAHHTFVILALNQSRGTFMHNGSLQSAIARSGSGSGGDPNAIIQKGKHPHEVSLRLVNSEIPLNRPTPGNSAAPSRSNSARSNANDIITAVHNGTPKVKPMMGNQNHRPVQFQRIEHPLGGVAYVPVREVMKAAFESSLG